jgi:hypothetical protein
LLNHGLPLTSEGKNDYGFLRNKLSAVRPYYQKPDGNNNGDPTSDQVMPIVIDLENNQIDEELKGAEDDCDEGAGDIE